jgi:hypothetical protein
MVDFYWLPLGAGGWFVKRCGRLYETLVSLVGHRPRRDLYHSALQVELDGERYVIEQAPVPDLAGEQRGVVAEGPVGSRLLRRFRLFRYEIRLWRGGEIPDIAEAVDSPRRLSANAEVARQVIDSIVKIPTPVWGRDEMHAGDMWNSNSVIAWTLASSGLDAASIEPPKGGRAPGWRAGLVAAGRAGSERQRAWARHR